MSLKYEIIVGDDNSSEKKIIKKNSEINKFKNCNYFKLNKNIGRSKIRNLLAKKSKYNYLLFLDADVKITRKNFIEYYLNKINLNTQVIYGGIVYQKERPESNQILRWKYGIKREALSTIKRRKHPHISFLSLNFLINKKTLMLINFNEEIPNLRHEDTLFSLDLKKEKIFIDHIDNPVIHLGLDTSKHFITKSEEAIDALHIFENKRLINPDEIKILRYVKRLYILKKIIVVLFKLFKDKMTTNLISDKPSLIIFDIYRLGYYFLSKK